MGSEGFQYFWSDCPAPITVTTICPEAAKMGAIASFVREWIHTGPADGKRNSLPTARQKSQSPVRLVGPPAINRASPPRREQRPFDGKFH